MKKLLIIFLGIVMISCATTANYEKILNSWVGSTELDLIRTWGSPDNQFESGGIKFLTYQKSGNVFVPGTNPTYSTTIIGNTAFTNAYGGSSAYNIQLNCKTTFEVKNERIISWRWEGNGCKSR